MHFSIPDTQELYAESSGTTYTGYNIYINGAYHCCLRYKQLHALHEQLRKYCIEYHRNDICLPFFPPKRLLPLTNGQLEIRRGALEQYLQMVGQDSRLAKTELLQNFLLNAQLETAANEGALDRYGDGGGYVTMEVLLMNNYTVPVTGRVSDNATQLLQKIAQCLKLGGDMVQYFCLFLARQTTTTATKTKISGENSDNSDNLFLIRRLMDFESPFLSRLHAVPICQLLLRTSHWNPAHAMQLVNDDIALNLLYLQTVADVEREWIIATPIVRQKLRALQVHGMKKEYLELARELPLYGCLQFQATHVDYAVETEAEIEATATISPILVSIGHRELSVRITRAAKIYETKFRVTRMRCWRVTAIHEDSVNDQETHQQQQAQLSFEYLMSKHVLRWITITSSQAMLMSVCLQAMVDELLEQSNKELIRHKNEVSTSTMAVHNNNNSSSNNNNNSISSSSSMPTIRSTSAAENIYSSSPSSPTAPIKFLAHRRSLKNNPKVYESTYAAVFFRKADSAAVAAQQQQLESVRNEAFEGMMIADEN